MALGDSTVEGVGASTPSKSFSFLVHTAIKQRNKHAKYYNFGKSGAKALDVLNLQVEKAIKLQPDLIVISMGFNDVVGKTKIADFKNNLSKVIKELSTKTHGLVVINTIPDISLARIPFYKKLYGKMMIKKFNQEIKYQVQNSKALLVDLHSHSLVLKGYKELVSDDGLHPSDLGHAIWGNTIISHIWNALFSVGKLSQAVQ